MAINPPDVTPITLDSLDRLGIDKFGHLYWDGTQIETVLSLPWWVQFATLVIAAAAVANFVWNVGWEIYQRRHPKP